MVAAALECQGMASDIIDDACVDETLVEPGARAVTDREVRQSTGAAREQWRTAAEAEIQGSFHRLGAVSETTPEELARVGGRSGVLPMKSVWTMKPGWGCEVPRSCLRKLCRAQSHRAGVDCSG